MNLTNIVLDVLELCLKIYAVMLHKPYLTARVEYTPQRDKEGNPTKETIAFTIINEGTAETEVRRAWLSTSFNRLISSELIDSKMPVRIRGRDRETYFMPMAEFKAALNKNVGETIIGAVVLDAKDKRHFGRANNKTQQAFAS